MRKEWTFKHSHKSRTCTQSMNTGWWTGFNKVLQEEDYVKRHNTRMMVLKEYWSFIVLNKHENKSHACLSPLDVTYVCELSFTCTDSRCTSQVSSSQQIEVWERPFCTSATGKHESALQDGTAIFRPHKGAFVLSHSSRFSQLQKLHNHALDAAHRFHF